MHKRSGILERVVNIVIVIVVLDKYDCRYADGTIDVEWKVNK